MRRLGILLLGIVLAVPAWAQTAGSQGHQVTLYSGTVRASGDLATVGIGNTYEAICVLKTTAVSGTNPTLDVYLQSVENGIDDDYCRFTQITGTGSQVLRFPMWGGDATTHAPSDLSTGVSAGHCRAGLIGTAVKVGAVLGGSNTPTVTIKLTCTIQG